MSKNGYENEQVAGLPGYAPLRTWNAITFSRKDNKGTFPAQMRYINKCTFLPTFF
jgi:hypothetical protein